MDVIEYRNALGKLTPLSFTWTDGTKFEIDEVLDVCRAASLKVGGFGQRYKVRISNDEKEIYNKIRYMYLEEGEPIERWFIEAK